MSFLKRRGRFDKYEEPLEDPISGVANLFDVSVVFIVSMMIALFMAYNMLDMMDPKSDMTIMKKKSDGSMEIISKKGKEIKVQKVTDKRLSGQGQRLGTAYKLKDGKVIYVPE
ncbi:MAG TPA: DUF2149 domain-containing protein [Deltaproteobacteria bacterium]|nr:DUF2149 domain-containing protein [Deltaproteobacteria bacterium]HQB39527.1 DUF2149 domain-containing protein [Deltaproteobacteria bacterium]